MWYRSKLSGKIITSGTATAIDLVHGDGQFNQMIEDGQIIPIDPPSVIDILRENGSIAAACQRYREIHPDADLKTARAAVGRLQCDMARFGGKG